MNKVLYDKNVDADTVFAALGDPLIKGLTEVANVKPKDPVAFLASFLHNFPDHEKPELGTQVSYVFFGEIIIIINYMSFGQDAVYNEKSSMNLINMAQIILDCDLEIVMYIL